MSHPFPTRRSSGLQHCEALAARAHAEFAAIHLEAHRLGEVAIAVGLHRHLAVAARALAPCAHHKSVVDGRAGDFIDALRLQIARLFDITRQMLGRAGGRERSGNGEKRHLAALEEIVGLHLLSAVLRHLHKSGAGQPVAFAYRHLVLRPARSESVSPSSNRLALSPGSGPAALAERKSGSIVGLCPTLLISPANCCLRCPVSTIPGSSAPSSPCASMTRGARWA